MHPCLQPGVLGRPTTAQISPAQLVKSLQAAQKLAASGHGAEFAFTGHPQPAAQASRDRLGNANQTRLPEQSMSTSAHHGNSVVKNRMPATAHMLKPDNKIHLGTTPAEPTLDDNKSFRPVPDGAHEEQLFRGSPPKLPCAHSEAAPRHAIHAANWKCVPFALRCRKRNKAMCWDAQNTLAW